jgi:nicotinamide-nucleotide amidase
MHAAIVSIGSELLQGVITDSNATFLAQELTNLGIEVTEVVQNGDDFERLAATFSRLFDEVDLIVSTGGLGPTDDDLTRETLAAICGETPRVDAELLEQIRAHFHSRGLTATRSKRGSSHPPKQSPIRWAPRPAGSCVAVGRSLSRCPARRARTNRCGDSVSRSASYPN